MCIRGVLLILLMCLCAHRITCFHVKYHENDDEALILKQQQGSKFTIEDLLTTSFPKKTSNDQDLDICKAGAFLGDIAIPEKSIDKEVISQLKKEVREGLQVEEEGLTDAVRIKLKLHVGYDQSTASPHSNEPIETKPFDVKSVKNVKNGISLNKHSSTNNQKSDTVESKQKIINDTTNGVSSKNDKLIEYNPNSTSYGDILKVTDELVTSSNDEVAEETTTDQPEDTTKRRRHRRRRRRYRKKKSKQHRERGSSDVRKANEEKTREGGDLASGQTLEHSSSNKQPSKRSVDELYTTHIEDENIVTAVTKLPNNYKSDNNNNIDREDEETQQNFERQEQVRFVVADGKTPSSQHHQLADSGSSPKRHRRGSSRRRTIRAATARKERVWDFGVIPYEIDGNFSGAHKALFKQAMRHWENFTCVKFVERVPEEHPHYIVFTERPCGCCSFVGKRGNGAQAISIGKNCDKFGIVVHELGHVVGFWHEHTRPDRDQHVQIYRDHIMSGQEYNFNKLTDEEVNSLGLPYDYDSIMHYARNTFSKGTYLDTIAPHEKQIRGKKVPEIGQRLRLSAGDIAQTNLLYKCYKCGRTFQENSGAFASPSYPVPSKEPERCEWRITATHGERIVLNITELDIYKSPNCGSDYIEIRDGYWHKSPVLGRFCGSGRLNEPIVSVGSRMLVTFITSPRQNGYRGFQASYEAVCGGVYQVSGGGHLESPNYPEDYKRNKECIWKLIVPPDYTVALRFQSFEIENHDNCVYDYVEVIDGFEPNSPVLGRFCGYKAPPDIKSKSNQLLVKFFSDSSVQKAGFSATFMKEYNECDHYDHGCEHYCINTLGSYECSCRIGFELHSDGKSCEAACGGIYDIPNGTITSPSFPDMYPGNKNCQWEIIAPPQYRITLNFTHFELEGNNLYHQECEYDSVVVESKIGDEIIRKHGTFCGSKKPELITSEGNVLKVSFNSDFTVHKSGFAAIFFTDMDECAIDNGGCEHECINTVGSYRCSCHNGFVLHENQHMCKEGGCKYEVTSPYGEIQSPNYPDYYPSRKDCVWHFTTTPGHRIKLIFNKFEMEPHQECAYDHVVFYDGDSPDSRILGRYCGSKVPHPIIASTNQMFMVFKSDASVQRKGFKAMHSTACGGHLLATDTVKHIYSHSRYGDYNYDNRADCDWSIEAAPGKNVHLTFLTFELEDEINCNYDYVEVFSGLDSSGPLYGRFCGNQNPTDIISDNEALLLRFKSDDTIVSKGFSASYVAIDQYDELGFEALKHTKPSSDEYYGEEVAYNG